MHLRLHRVLAIVALALAALSGNASAQVYFSIQIGPPPPLVEQIPLLMPGQLWAPGYWAWHDNRHIWIRGRPLMQRVGYRWEPDMWEQRNNLYYRHPGRWERNTGYRAGSGQMLGWPDPRAQSHSAPGSGKGYAKKPKKQKKSKD